MEVKEIATLLFSAEAAMWLAGGGSTCGITNTSLQTEQVLRDLEKGRTAVVQFIPTRLRNRMLGVKVRTAYSCDQPLMVRVNRFWASVGYRVLDGYAIMSEPMSNGLAYAVVLMAVSGKYPTPSGYYNAEVVVPFDTTREELVSLAIDVCEWLTGERIGVEQEAVTFLGVWDTE